MASSSSKKGKSKALRSQQISQRKGSHVCYHPSLIDIIQKYEEDHDHEWDSISKAKKDKYYEAYQRKEEAIAQSISFSDTDSAMSQGGSRAASPHSGNRPTQSTSQLPSAILGTAGPLTLGGLAQIMYDLGQGLGHLTNQMTLLTQQVARATKTQPRATKVAVA